MFETQNLTHAWMQRKKKLKHTNYFTHTKARKETTNRIRIGLSFC